MEATILGSLGWLALRLWNFDHMRNFIGDSLFLRMDIGDKGGIAWCLEKLAEGAIAAHAAWQYIDELKGE